MSIKSLVDDAIFLKENGRYLGAFTVLMLAVAASSRLTFPKGTASRIDPNKSMGDGEAFRLFLGARIRKILMGLEMGPDEGPSSLDVPFNGRHHDIAYIFYKFYRNGLIHEGDLPSEVDFSPARQDWQGLKIAGRGFCVCISFYNNRLTLDYPWIDLLVGVVKGARCNGAEFGIEHYELLPNIGVDPNKFLLDLAEQYETTRGRVDILRYGLQSMPPELVPEMSDRDIVNGFHSLCKTDEITGGAMTGLRTHGFMDDTGFITQRGLALFRQLALGFHRIRLT